MTQFAGAVAAVTGAGSGMGRALSLALARRGCHLALCDVDEHGLDQTAAELQALRGRELRVTRHVVDVADQAAVEDFARAAVAAHGRVHFVFNNAGVSLTGPVELLSYPDFHWLMNVNFWGVVHGSRSFLAHFREAGGGHIVNTSSVFGLIGVPTQSAYNASKFAVKGFTDALRAELDGSGVDVSCVMPGGVKTAIVRRSRYVMSENDAPTREDAAREFERLAGLTPDEAAERILRGVARRRARILVGRDARLIGFALRLIPVAYLRLMVLLQRRRRPAPVPGETRQSGG
jgi:NAD(P)-dependent dehydrogenase (short-subunit alcohol dehydrogenase family)